MKKTLTLVALVLAAAPVWARLNPPTIRVSATETPSVIVSLHRGTPVQGEIFHHYKIYRRLRVAGGCGMDADDVQATPKSSPWTDTYVFDYYHYAYEATEVATDGSESAYSNCVMVIIP